MVISSALPPQVPDKTSRLARWWPVLVGGLIFMALVSLSLSLIYVNQRQDVRQQAAPTGEAMTLNWRSRTDNNKLIIEAVLNTRDYAVAGVELRGSITGVKSPSVTISTSNPVGLQPVLNELKDQSGNGTDFIVTMFAPLSTNQPVTTKNSDQVVASFTISNVPSDGVEVRFNGDTRVPALERPEATLSLGGSQRYKLAQNTNPDDGKKSCNQNCATDTECKTDLRCHKGQCRHKDDVEDSECKKLADDGLQRSCNQYCADGRECQNQYVCYFNQCRNPKNIMNTSCANAPSPTPRTVSTGNPGVGGRVSPRPTPSPTPTPRITAQNLTFVSPSPVASVSARPTPTATTSGRVSPTPTLFSSPRSTPRPVSPIPSPSPASQGGGAGRVIFAVIAILAGLGLFAFSIFKLFRR